GDRESSRDLGCRSTASPDSSPASPGCRRPRAATSSRVGAERRRCMKRIRPARLRPAKRPIDGRSGRRLARDTRERLVSAARELLEEGGYVAASVQAISARAGVATGGLYRHFPSKEDLFVEVFRDAARRDLAAMRDAASSGSCLERLEAAVVTFA